MVKQEPRCVGQVVDDPLSDLHLIADTLREAELLARGDLQVRQLLQPAIAGLLAVGSREDTQVGDDTRGDENVTYAKERYTCII